MCLFLSLVFLICFSCVSGSPHPQIGMKFLEIAARHGYPAEEHEVESEDGYFIRHHRIPHGKNQTRNNPYPIILLPGFSGTSECFILLEDDESLGFVLADNGYDVWILNNRGNFYAKKHKYLDPRTDKKFWDYTFHEQAYYDLPAAIDHVLKVSGSKTVTLIGHSLGSAVEFIFLAVRPEYKNKIDLMVHFAPSAYLGDSPILGYQLLIKHLPFLQHFLSNVANLTYLPSVQNELFGLSDLCTTSKGIGYICFESIAMIDYGVDYEVFNKTVVLQLLSYMPSTISMKTAFHYFQLFSSGEFKQFDYGPEENLKHYNSTKPPVYDLRNVTIPNALFYNPKDTLSPYTGVIKLKQILRKPIMYGIKDNNLRHMFYLISSQVKTIYPRLLPLLKKYSRK